MDYALGCKVGNDQVHHAARGHLHLKRITLTLFKVNTHCSMTHCNIACHGEPCKSQHWERLSRICCAQYADAEEYAHALDYSRVEEYAGHGGVTSAKEEGEGGGGIAQTTGGLTHLSCGGHQCSRRLAWFYQLSYHKVWFSTWVQVCMYYRYTVEVFFSRMKRSLDLSEIPSLPLSFTQYNLWEPFGQKVIKQDDCNLQHPAWHIVINTVYLTLWATIKSQNLVIDRHTAL